MFSSPFDQSVNKIEIPNSTQIVFVSDMFSQDHIGGAELTTDAIIDSSPYEVYRLHSKDVTMEILSENADKYWIFGNFSGMNSQLVPTIIANMKYSVVEYDYKYCRYRSPEKHMAAENSPCDCQNQMSGKIVSAFYYAANSIWWMSQKQMEKYHTMFPFLARVKNVVLSSVFSERFFIKAAEILETTKETQRKGWVIVGSTSWIKGVDQAKQYCEKEGLEYEVVWDLPYDDMLKKFASSEGLVFLPLGSDTCPRTTIEAKVLGCDLVLNENVQHASEEWFATTDNNKMMSHLYEARSRFWAGISEHLENIPTISGYTTTHNCIKQDYPFLGSINSMLGFCDQVVVVDGGSTDGTWEALEELSKDNEKLIIHKQERDFEHKRFALYDGLQKALARALCTGEFCWQQDSDEIIHEDDYEKVKNIIKNMPKNMDLIALPVIEYWGGPEKVRLDINPWKWRLSRNRPHITHGVPASLRRYDEDGDMFSLPGTDGCDYIRSDTFETINFANFYTEEAHNLRSKALEGDVDSLSEYQAWITSVADTLPVIHHYSWYNLERKINTYKNYWSKHWQSLYDIKQEDTSENNMFFNKPWSKVTKKDIKNLSKKLREEMGGWIFHSKVDFNKKTPHLDPVSTHPKCIQYWIKK